ncbi:MAG: DUF1501 domain-containing protein [Oculatellaceae cyanobacterium Prado106]|jgi:uncharacterized protein (DUF1501 family)|nr:DUF1501 domain-containing protein [Oculatellaceae cyanobacterium Prado106]
MNRRQFLQLTGLSAAGTLLGLHPWTTVSMAQTRSAPSHSPKRLLVIFLRGAVDGLNVLVPYRESAYYQARPNIAIPQPGQPGGALQLDDTFGLHPALEPLMPLWRQGSLAFLTASGSPDLTRSHFDAQDYMETGTPGDKSTSAGWLNRLLAILPEQDPVEALSLGASIPRILQGTMPVANLPLGRGATRPLPLDQAQTAAAFNRLYSGQDELSQTFQEGLAARRTLRSHLLAEQQAERMAADNGAPTPINFPEDAKRLARLMRQEPKIRLAFTALGGWDTHIDQGGSQGELADRLGSLGQGLAVLAEELGEVYADTTIAVLSEFGRTVRENGNGGTDHGHGNTLWLLGGGIRGGQVHGEWPGLERDRLHQGRDLAITTDFRDAIANVLQHQLQLERSQLSQVFPGYGFGKMRSLQICR